jgi:hypothetical protein
VLGMWLHEGGAPYGQSPLQKLSNNPLNIRADNEGRLPFVMHPTKGNPFYAFESPMLGLEFAILHLKNVYGWDKKLFSLEQIAPVWAPSSDGNATAVYVNAVKIWMSRIRTGV